MKRSIKITKAKFVVTMDSERRIIKDGAVLIENDRIVKVGKTDASIDWDADQVIDASEMVITPGLLMDTCTPVMLMLLGVYFLMD